MDRGEIKEHWEGWAQRYGTGLRATTKARTAKRLEIDAIERAIRRFAGRQPRPQGTRLLEIGCGNGRNCLALADAFPELRFAGVDYARGMIEMARQNVKEAGLEPRIALQVGDVLELDDVSGLDRDYDLVLSNRCLVNLPTIELQLQALVALTDRVAPGGLLILVENCIEPYERQNDLRERAGLPRREPAEFNLFLDEGRILPVLERRMELVCTEDFIALHDLVLYVLIPATCAGEVDYEHPMVEAATRLSLELTDSERSALLACGQLRMFVARQPEGGR